MKVRRSGSAAIFLTHHYISAAHYIHISIHRCPIYIWWWSKYNSFNNEMSLSFEIKFLPIIFFSFLFLSPLSYPPHTQSTSKVTISVLILEHYFLRLIFFFYTIIIHFAELLSTDTLHNSIQRAPTCDKFLFSVSLPSLLLLMCRGSIITLCQNG